MKRRPDLKESSGKDEPAEKTAEYHAFLLSSQERFVKKYKKTQFSRQAAEFCCFYIKHHKNRICGFYILFLDVPSLLELLNDLHVAFLIKLIFFAVDEIAD